MSEPSPKRQKADDGDVATLKAPGAEALEGLEGGLGAPDVAEEAWVNDLEDCQKALDKVNDEASDRVLAVEQEYNKKRRPIYAQRAEIIKRVPQFWQKALSSHQALVDSISDDDLQVLEFMTELDVVDFDDIKSGFKIVLKFQPDNPCLSNSTLVKSFHYGDDGRIAIEPANIDWKENYTPGVCSYVFFEWMASSKPVVEGALDEIAEVIKDDIWPNPSKYYFADLPAEQDFGEDDEGGMLDGEGFEGMLPPEAGEEGDGEGEEGEPLDEAEVVYDEAEEALGGDVDAGAEGLEGGLEGPGDDFGDDGGGDGEGAL